MLTQFSRTELLLGKEAMQRLEGARVAVFGIGGVVMYVRRWQEVVWARWIWLMMIKCV